MKKKTFSYSSLLLIFVLVFSVGNSFALDEIERNIGYLKIDGNFGSHYKCMTSIIGPKLLLTAAHCVTDEKDASFKNNYQVFFPDGRRLNFSRKTAWIFMGDKRQKYQEKKFHFGIDYALIYLKDVNLEANALSFRIPEKLPHMPQKIILTRGDLGMSGFFRVNATLEKHSCEILGKSHSSSLLLRTNCNAIKGDSGGPLYYCEKGESFCDLYGIVNGSQTSYSILSFWGKRLAESTEEIIFNLSKLKTLVDDLNGRAEILPKDFQEIIQRINGGSYY